MKIIFVLLLIPFACFAQTPKVIGITVVNPLTQKTAQLIKINENNRESFVVPELDGDSWGWPNPNDDLGTDKADIGWLVQTIKLHQLVLNNGIRLRINGVSLVLDQDYKITDGADNCPTQSLCFTTTIRRSGWPRPAAFGPNVKTIGLDYEGAKRPIIVFIVPSLYPVSYFLAHMVQTFKAPRCFTCHQQGSAEQLAFQHGNALGTVQDMEAFAESVMSEPSPIMAGDRLTCTVSCHTQQESPVQAWEFEDEGLPLVDFSTTEWVTPSANMGVNWVPAMGEPMLDKQICDKASSLTPAQLNHHFHEDGRMAWAVHNGEVPGAPDLQTSPPHNYFDWIDIVDPWINAGAPCPPVPDLPDDFTIGCAGQWGLWTTEYWMYCVTPPDLNQEGG